MAVEVEPRPDAAEPPAGAAAAPTPESGATVAKQAAKEKAAADKAVRETKEKAARKRLKDVASAKQPFAAISLLRLALSLLLVALVLLTAAGALLLLMAWRQESSDGLATGQTERLWDIWQVLADVERYVALVAAPIAVLWVALAAANITRATSRAKWGLLSAVALAAGLVGVWIAGRELVEPADDWVGQAIGIAVQAACVIVPMLFVDRLANAAEARRRPLHMTAVMGIGYLVVLETIGALSTIDRTTDIDGWDRGATYVLIATLIELLGTLAATEAMRAVEEGTEHRYELRARFGEAVLQQAGL